MGSKLGRLIIAVHLIVAHDQAAGTPSDEQRIAQFFSPRTWNTASNADAR